MMQSLQHLFQTLFHFTSTDRGAFIVLIPLMLLLAGWPRIFFSDGVGIPDLPSGTDSKADSIYRIWKSSDEKKNQDIRPVPFDPNQFSAAAFRSMGLDSVISERIVRYREKGGKFRKQEDLFRIWGMDSTVAKKLLPFMQLQSESDTSRKPFQLKSEKSKSIEYDLNRADTSDFESVQGIGWKTASRIIKYRAALGGFVQKEQLYEVFGIDSLAVFSMDKFFIAPGFNPAILDLNKATYEELEAHPYLSDMQAKAILFYRYQHSDYHTAEDLMKVKRMDAKTIERLKPYIRSSVP